MTVLANLYQPGSGITSLGAKLPPAVAARIEWIGRMSDRLNECLANGDRAGLLELAAEYATHPYMITQARRIAMLAETEK